MKSIPFPQHPDGRGLPAEPRPPHPAPPGERLLWLVRHGEVLESHHGLAYGGEDVPLSETGLSRTAAIGAEFAGLHLRAVFASNLERATRLGQAIAAADGVPLTVDPRIREIDRGEWQGSTKERFAAGWAADVESFYRDPEGWSAPGGESDRTVWERASAALFDAFAATPHGDVAIAAHNNWIRVVVTRLLGLSPAQSFAFRLRPTHLCVLRSRAKRWELIAADLDSPRAPELQGKLEGSDGTSASTA